MGMIELTIDSVRISLTNQQRIVMLRELERERYLPIWIGPFEAESITISLQEIEVARPQTHDLLLQALEAVGARLLRIEIIALKSDIFFGNLVVELNGQSYLVDSRPSDAIALAVRAHVPILATEEIMNEAGIIPEADISDLVLHEHEPINDTIEDMDDHQDAQKRLSIFEDFINRIDKEDDPNPPADSSSTD